MSEDSLPPHDEKAEWFLLACAVNKPSIIPAIDSRLFYVENARRVLLKMQQAWSEKAECMESPDAFEHWIGKGLEPHYFEPLFHAISDLPSSSGWGYWRSRLEDTYRARALEKLKPKISEVSERVARGDSANDILLEITRIANQWRASKAESLDTLVPKVISEWEELWKEGKYPGLVTGYIKFDKLTRGLQNNRLYIIGARPGKGKSTIAANLALRLAYRQTSVFFVTLEMSATEVTGRLVSCESKVSEEWFAERKASQRDFESVTGAMDRIRKLPLKIDDGVRGLADIVGACHRAASEGAKVIFIDYLQKITVQNFRHNRNELVTQISGAMKDIAMSLRVPVVCCAQLNRESEKEEREPTLSDLRDSGSVEQDADFVGLLYENKDQTDLIVPKNRSGREGRIAFKFHKEIFRFDEV